MSGVQDDEELAIASFDIFQLAQDNDIFQLAQDNEGLGYGSFAPFRIFS